VYRLDQTDANLKALLESLTQQGERSIMIQKYMSDVTEVGDRRVIVLGGEPIGAISRLPGGNDFRSNFHSGGSAGETGVRPSEREICEDLSDELLKRGLHLVGLDLISDKITEINVTSPTCVQEINRGSNTKLEEDIVNYALDFID
ncbi:MAG: glutathione synthase, partial [bacterium]